MRVFKGFVPQEQNQQKIDRVIVAFDFGLSRKRIRSILDQGHVTVNGKRERFASRRVVFGDSIVVKEIQKSAQEQKIVINDKNLVLYEDKDVVVINKPPMISSEKRFKTDPRTDACDLVKKIYGKESQFILCHRLDKDTTGCLVFAKSKESSAWIFEQFKNRKIDKTYHAICFGKPPGKSWDRKDHLSSLNKKTQKVEIVSSSGKAAITSFATMNYNKQKNISLINCKPLTGRTHQLRVQLQDSHLPIVGDKNYTDQHPPSLKHIDLIHHLLHAQKISFQPAPQTKRVTLTAPYPRLFENVIKTVQTNK